MEKRKYVLEFIEEMVRGSSDAAATASLIVERLTEEGLLNVGYGNKDVELIISAFKQAFDVTKITKYDRFAATRLADKHGSQAIVGIISLLDKHRDERFIPVVNNVAQLEEKLPSILNFLRNMSSNETLDF